MEKNIKLTEEEVKILKSVVKDEINDLVELVPTLTGNDQAEMNELLNKLNEIEKKL